MSMENVKEDDPECNKHSLYENVPLLSPKETNDKTIKIPESEKTSFSFKKLWAFTGPGFLMSIGFLDPGNISSDLQTGTLVQYQLLWVLLCSTICGLIMQRLSARLGTVTKLHLAELCYIHYKKVPRILLWIMVEIAILGADMQEVIGTAIAIYLLSNTLIPIWGGVLITILDTLLFLYLDNYGLRKLELLFAILIAIMAITFGYEFFITGPDFLQILEGTFIPWYTSWHPSAILQAVGIIGSIFMPHNLYLHSALVISRDVDKLQPAKVREANFYFFLEATLAVIVSFFINLFVVSVFGHGLYAKSNLDIREKCSHDSFFNSTAAFHNNLEVIEPELYSAGIFLGCTFGIGAMYIWGVGILASGQSATMTGTYAGQFVIEGFLNLQWSLSKRSLFCRSITIVPTLILAFSNNVVDLTNMNTYLNAIMSLQLPFAIIPTIAFTSNAQLMGEFVNSKFSMIFSSVLGITIIVINTLFVAHTILINGVSLYVLIIVIIISCIYLLFCLYLIIHMGYSAGIIKLKKYKYNIFSADEPKD